VIGQDGRSKATDLRDGASVFWVTGEKTRGIDLSRFTKLAVWRTRIPGLQAFGKRVESGKSSEQIASTGKSIRG
jgi:hypothetical protein